MRYCHRCKKQTEHHMDNGILKCALCMWKRIN
jgi:ribosomal protein L37AE/L43A